MSESHAPYVDDEPTLVTRVDALEPRPDEASGEIDSDETIVTPTLRVLPLPAPDEQAEEATPSPCGGRDGVGGPSRSEPTLSNDLEATVIEPIPPSALRPGPPPAAPPLAGQRPDLPPRDLYELFAEPPRIDEAPEESRTDRRARRRKLLLAFAAIAGAWLVLRPALQPQPPPPSEVVAIEPAAAEVEPAPSPSLAEPAGPVSVADAAAHLGAGRYEEALPLYRALAAESPDDEAFAAIVDVLTREVVERCRARTSSACSR